MRPQVVPLESSAGPGDDADLAQHEYSTLPARAFERRRGVSDLRFARVPDGCPEPGGERVVPVRDDAALLALLRAEVRGISSSALQALCVRRNRRIAGVPLSLLCGRRLLTILYRPQYGDHVTALAILVAAAGVSATAFFVTSGLNSARCFRAQLPIFAASTLTTIVGCMFLVPQYQLNGAAAALLLSAIVGLLGNLWVLDATLKSSMELRRRPNGRRRVCDSLMGSAWAWRAVSRLLRGDRNSVMIVYVIFYAEYATPLGLNMLLGPPDYTQQPGFAISSQDPYVRIFYCVFLFLVPLVWVWNAKIHNRTVRTPSPTWAIIMLRLGSILPVCLVFAAPQPGLYLQYAGVMRANAGLDVLIFHIVVSMGTMVAVLCVAGRCLIEPLRGRTILEVAIATALSVWINGKRYIVAEALMFVILALWYRGAIPGRKLVWAMLTGVVLLGAFSVSYQFNVRGFSDDPLSRDAAGEDMRVDYTRDSRVQMALFSTLYPDKMQILDHAGQNLPYYATLLVPRTMWPNKPYPYAYYFTSAMLNCYPQDFGWGMTTGIFDETIRKRRLAGYSDRPAVDPMVLCRG